MRSVAWSIAYAGIATFLLNAFSGVVGESPIWLPAGIGLGVLLVFGLHYWPLVFIGATLGEMGGGHHVLLAMQLAAGSVLSFVLAAIILKRYFKFDVRFETLRDCASLFLVSFLAAAISSTLNIQFLILDGLIFPGNLMPIYKRWFTGDFFGLAFVTPILLVLHQPGIFSWPKQKQYLFIFSLLAAFLFGQAVFFSWLKEFVDLTERGMLFVFIISLFGYYFGRQGALLLFALVMVQSILGAFHGVGYFDSGLMSKPAPQMIWVYLSILAGVGLVISLAVKRFKAQNQGLKKASWLAIESSLHFKAIVSSVPILMATYDLNKQQTDYVNPFFTKVLGYTTADFLKPGAWWKFLHPDPTNRHEFEAEWNRRVQEASQTQKAFRDMEVATTCKDGALRFISWGCFLASDRMVIYGNDITDRKQSEEFLSISSAVYQAMGEAVVINDAKNTILLANDAFKDLTGYGDEGLLGNAFSDFLVKRHGASSYSDIFTSLDAVGRWEGQAWIRMSNGEELLRFLSIYSTFNQDGVPLQRVALISQVTDQRKARELINQQANFDPLTGLPNRRLMLDRLDQLIKQSTRSQSSLAIIYIDLDNFKDINDSRGHDFGDELLRAVAFRLRSEVRETDTVARIGGDEFVVLLGQLDRPEKADLIIQQILKKLVEPVQIQGQSVYVTASFGISMFPTDGDDAKALLLSADQAMYAAKANGRNGYQYFTTTLQIKANYRAGIISELRTAIAKKEFKLEYQPIIELQTGVITHVEALLRWHKANGEVLMPSAFIEIAEESGLIVEIGNLVFQDALSFLKSFGNDKAPSIAINVSAAQFNSANHSAHDWIQQISNSGVAPQKIVLEITERMMLIQSQRVLRKIALFQKAGCQFSVDDFGTGYSSLMSLKNFNFDYLKIDAHFINSLSTSSLDASLVAAMISMAKGLGLSSVAEGVETQAQAELLKEMGCTLVQGYLYSRPLSPEAIKKILV
jgi:diguanylate cyclase (GGDEF)-like protein/PAS domain S-box-containing protein